MLQCLTGVKAADEGNESMHILVYGAGVIGSVYAARLQGAGHTVTLLARGQRAADVRAHGILLEDFTKRRQTTTPVAVIEQLDPMATYDLVLVTVRWDHLAAILPSLAANHQIPIILFMLNNPEGMAPFTMLDAQRMLFGFPVIGGERDGEVIRYRAVRFVPTPLGEVDGQVTPRLRELAATFKHAGFPVTLQANMPAWLKTHALIDVGLVTAVMLAQGKSARLAQSPPRIRTMLQAIQEGLLALQAQGVPITPRSMKVIFLWMPRWLAVPLWQRVLRSRLVALGLDSHLDDATEELRQLASALLADLKDAPLAIPTLRGMLASLDPASAPHCVVG